MDKVSLCVQCVARVSAHLIWGGEGSLNMQGVARGSTDSRSLRTTGIVCTRSWSLSKSVRNKLEASIMENCSFRVHELRATGDGTCVYQ